MRTVTLKLPDTLADMLEAMPEEERNHFATAALSLAIEKAPGLHQKAGQSPSAIDLPVDRFSKYRGILSDEDMRELRQAEAAYSLNRGRDAFVSIRRAFKRQLEAAHQEAENSWGWSDEAETYYQKDNITDRIGRIAACLPTFVIQNRSLYGILSKDVHLLSDGEGMQYFPVLRSGVEAMLDETLRRQKPTIPESGRDI